MYYYGYNGGYNGGYTNPYCTNYVGTTQGGYGLGAALWIVLFILLVIIIGAGFTWNNNRDNNILESDNIEFENYRYPFNKDIMLSCWVSWFSECFLIFFSFTWY